MSGPFSSGQQDEPIFIDSDATTSEPDCQPPKDHPKVKSLQELAEQKVIEDLKDAVKGYQAKANYCLGGAIPISTSPTTYFSSNAPITCPPRTLRYDTTPTETAKIEFPLPAENTESIAQLLKTCTPATFGLEGKDVLDESYRKAGKIDRKDFSTDFHPYDYGVVDAIAQTLLPGIGNMMKEGLAGGWNAEHWGVVAELYKLNIYSGPSGMFHKHVDTPRGSKQFGSLVVCLPYPHQGGALKVSHKGHDTSFDWSNSSSTEVKWAAFYSDCTHEVLEVLSGHRVTLTYNLYVCEHIGGIIQKYPTADPSLYPLYEGAKRMLETFAFMRTGGKIGFYCEHQYAHTGKNTENLMPYALKGIDATLFAVFAALGAKVIVRPILKSEQIETYTENILDNMSGYAEDRDEWDKLREEKEEAFKAISRIGTEFHDLKLVGDELNEGDNPEEIFGPYWPHEEFRDIVWLNSDTKDGWEVAVVNMKYGNQAEMAWSYSHAVILIDVQPRAQRMDGAKVAEELTSDSSAFCADGYTEY